MRKEIHIQCGSMELFKEVLDNAKVKEVTEKVPESVSRLYGLPIYQNDKIPMDTAVLIDAEGNVMGVYNLAV